MRSLSIQPVGGASRGRGEESDRRKVGRAWRNTSDDLIQFQNLHVMKRVRWGYKGCSFLLTHCLDIHSSNFSWVCFGNTKLYKYVVLFLSRVLFQRKWICFVCARWAVLADETGRSDLEAELLRRSTKIVEHNVNKRHLFHFRWVDLKNSLFIALFQLQEERVEKQVRQRKIDAWNFFIYFPSTSVLTAQPSTATLMYGLLSYDISSSLEPRKRMALS